MSATPFPKYTACVLLFAVAAAAGWKSVGRREVVSGEQPLTMTKRERPPPRRSPGAAEAAAKMKAVRDAGTPQERMRAAVSLAMSLDPAEFAAWAEGDRFDLRAGSELHVFRFILFERWLAEDPESLIGWTVENNHGQAYRAVEDLLKNDPERAIAYFREHPNDVFELSKLTTAVKTDPGLVLARLTEMSQRGITGDAAGRARELFDALAWKSPEALEAALNGLSPALRDVADVSLAGMRLEKSFATEIKALWERPDGWKLFSEIISSNQELGDGLITQIAAMPASWKNAMADSPYYAIRSGIALEWLDKDLEAAGFTSSQAMRIKQAAIDRLVGANPTVAMSRLGSLGLDAKKKSQLFSSAMMRLVGSPGKAEEMIASLASEEDRMSAREQLEIAKLGRGSNEARSPSELLGILGAADTSGTSSWYLARATGNWTAEQVSDYKKSFGELGAAEREKVALLFSSRAGDVEGNEEIFGDAVRYLVNNPPATTGNRSSRDNTVFSASQYAVKIASNSLPEASAWIDTLPDGDAKMWARRNVASDLNQYDPGAVRDWMKTLPAGTRDDLRTYLDSGK